MAILIKLVSTHLDLRSSTNALQQWLNSARLTPIGIQTINNFVHNPTPNLTLSTHRPDWMVISGSVLCGIVDALIAKREPVAEPAAVVGREFILVFPNSYASPLSCLLRFAAALIVNMTDRLGSPCVCIAGSDGGNSGNHDW